MKKFFLVSMIVLCFITMYSLACNLDLPDCNLYEYNEPFVQSYMPDYTWGDWYEVGEYVNNADLIHWYTYDEVYQVGHGISYSVSVEFWLSIGYRTYLESFEQLTYGVAINQPKRSRSFVRKRANYVITPLEGYNNIMRGCYTHGTKKLVQIKGPFYSMTRDDWFDFEYHNVPL